MNATNILNLLLAVWWFYRSYTQPQLTGKAGHVRTTGILLFGIASVLCQIWFFRWDGGSLAAVASFVSWLAAFALMTDNRISTMVASKLEKK